MLKQLRIITTRDIENSFKYHSTCIHKINNICMNRSLRLMKEPGLKPSLWASSLYSQESLFAS